MGNQVVIPEKPIKEQIREQKRNIDRSIRGIEREKNKVEREEKKMRAEIKKMALKNQHAGAKMMARDIVRMKTQINKMTEFTGQLKAVSLRISGISTLNELSNAMDEAGKAMTIVSSKLDSGKLAQMAQQLAREDAKLDMKQDMMSDILDSIGEGMDDPVQQDEIYKQVLQECGLEMPDANKKAIVSTKETNAKVVDEEDSLDAMLKSLQK